MEHAPILASIATTSAMVKNMNLHSMTLCMESNINSNDGMGWKNNSKVHQNGQMLFKTLLNIPFDILT